MKFNCDWRLVVLSSVLILIFFFFQAEDGIRDLTVTGVQTCAIPISPAQSRAGNAAPLPYLALSAAAVDCAGGVAVSLWFGGFDAQKLRRAHLDAGRRSEERRVGK